MDRARPYVQLLLVCLYITLFFIVVMYFYGEQTKELQAKNENLQAQVKDLESQNQYLNAMPTEFKEKNGYDMWPELEKTADRMVSESEGEFNKSWALYLARESKRYDINPYLVYELLKVETGGTFDPTLVGPETKYGHAYGMAQFMTNTAPWIADMGDLPYKKELLFDPYYAMQLSLIYLDYLHHEYGNWDEALTAYHRGMGGLEKYKEENGHAESWYAVEIQQKAKTHDAVAVAP